MEGLGTCDALLCVAHSLQSALEMGQKDRIVQIDFSAAFDRVNCAIILRYFRVVYCISNTELKHND